MEKPSSQKVENPLREIDFKPEFYSLEKADRFYHLLKEELNWKQGFVRLFGRTMEEPPSNVLLRRCRLQILKQSKPRPRHSSLFFSKGNS